VPCRVAAIEILALSITAWSAGPAVADVLATQSLFLTLGR
jgi:hypothetical protein